MAGISCFSIRPFQLTMPALQHCRDKEVGSPAFFFSGSSHHGTKHRCSPRVGTLPLALKHWRMTRNDSSQAPKGLYGAISHCQTWAAPGKGRYPSGVLRGVVLACPAPAPMALSAVRGVGDRLGSCRACTHPTTALGGAASIVTDNYSHAAPPTS